MTVDFIRNRITELRLQKNVSEYKMSYDLGHSKGYVQSITSGRAMPSTSEILYICEYFEITPEQFFSENVPKPIKLERTTRLLKVLDDADLDRILDLAERLSEKQEDYTTNEKPLPFQTADSFILLRLWKDKNNRRYT